MFLTPKIISVKILDNYRIYLHYETGEEKIYNMEKLIHDCKFYKNLKDREKFKKVKIVDDLLEWETGEDIAPEILYQESTSLN